MPENAAITINLYVYRYTSLLRLISSSHDEHHWTLSQALSAVLHAAASRIWCARLLLSLYPACLQSRQISFGVRAPKGLVKMS